jgi:hypothetical protein
MRVVVFRTDSAGTVEVHTSSTPGARVAVATPVPGAYHAEVWLRPLHLETALGSAAALADREYLWIITNPIYVP